MASPQAIKAPASVRKQSADGLENRAKPVLKWAGGKRALLPELLARLPEKINSYYEPFFGGGALFFAGRFPSAVIGDVNKELINVYRVIRDHSGRLLKELEKHPYEKEHFYRVRAQAPSALSAIRRAARFIYLNKTCFNGLYRVNSRGEFNVPFGAYKNPRIRDPETIREASARLRGVTLQEGGYRETTASAQAGDFVYFDPPYEPVSATSRFVSYSRDGFTSEDQADLAYAFRELDARGVRCLLSNSSAPLIRKLYRGFKIETVYAPRSVNSSASGRGKVAETLIRNY